MGRWTRILALALLAVVGVVLALGTRQPDGRAEGPIHVRTDGERFRPSIAREDGP